jgi:hypothetical protein
VAPITPDPGIEKSASQRGGLTKLANQVKRLGQMSGAVVQIVLAITKDGKRILVAGINSGSKGFTAAQLALLKSWGVNIAPETLKGMEESPHAEENIAAYLQSIRARPLKWSKAVVGEVKAESKSYICSKCRSLIRLMGGETE